MVTRTLGSADFDGTWGEVYPEPQTIWVRHPQENIYARIDGRLHVRTDVSLLGVDVLVDGPGSTAVVWKATVPPAEPAERFDVLTQARMGSGDDVVDLTGPTTGYPGAVRLEGEAGDDVLWAGEGDDRLDGDAGADNLHGGNGADELFGGPGIDRLRGGDGADTLDGGAGTDLVSGGAGDDTIRVRSSQAEFEVLAGGGGTDLLLGEGADPIILDGFSPASSIERVDTQGQPIEGNGGANELDFSAVLDLDVPRIGGRGGSDVILGNAQGNALGGDGGDDLLRGLEGDDSLEGGAGDDVLRGGGGADTLAGGAGGDLLNGAGGGDLLLGGAGIDLLIGGAGGDRVDGGAGDDQLSLDDGADTIAVGPNFGTDRVNDFVGGVDRVDLPDGWTFTTGGAGNLLVVRDATGITMGTIDATNGHLWTAADII